MTHPEILAARPGGQTARRRTLRKSHGPLRKLNLWHGPTRDAGSSLVEFAVSVPLFFGVFFGIMWFALALYTDHAVSEAARDTARWAMVRGSTSCSNTPNLTHCDATAAQIQSYAQNLDLPAINTGNIAVATTWLSPSASPPTTWSTCTVSPCNAPGNAVQVVLTYNFPLKIPFINSELLDITSTSQLVIAQ